MPIIKTIAARLLDIALVIAVPSLLIVLFAVFQTVRPERVLSERTPELFGLAYEDVRFRTADDVDLAAWYVPATAAPTDASIVVLHGYPADKGDILPHTAFLSRDYNLLFVDFRYFGQSDGAYTTVGAKETEDLLAAVRYLKGRGAGPIGVYGFSMGGAVALMATAQTDAIGAVVSEAAYADLPLMAESLFRGFGPLARPLARMTGFVSALLLRMDLADVSPARAAVVADVPILVIHAKDDQVVPFAHALLLQEALRDHPDAEFSFFEGLSHGEAPPEFPALLFDFFGKHLKS